MSFNVPISEIENQVLEFMDNYEISPAERHLKIDGVLHRYKTLDDKGSATSGAYCIYPDNLPAGFVQDWRSGIKLTWFFRMDGLSQEQQEYLNSPKVKAEAEKIRKQREKEREQAAIKASENARILWESMKPADNSHPYLQRKKVNCYGLRVNEQNDLAVPLRNISGQFRTLQWIPAKEGELKNFYPGATVAGAFWSIALDTLKDNPHALILLGEGYATMAKIYELTSLPCVAAMNCYMLKPVAEILKKKYKGCKIIILADDDAETKKKTGINAGLDHALKACAELALQGVFPPPFKSSTDGTDWDDFALKYGDNVTAKILKEKIPQFLITETEKKEKEIKKELSNLVSILDPTVNIEQQEFIGAMFPRKFVSAIVAPSGTGKTMFMQKYVSDLSIGGTIFDGFTMEEPPRTSLIFAGEAGYELLIRRGASTKWRINPQKVKVVDQYKFESKNFSVSIDNKEGWKNILRLVEMYKPDIVFFDTLSSFHDKDENKASEMKPILKKLTDLARDFNLAVVVVHHSRKRTARERALSLSQDDVIGSSIFNRLVALIVGIEPLKEDEKTLLVRPLKTWFSAFTPFTYKISEDNSSGRTVIETDLAPASVNNSRITVWTYIEKTFSPDTWFSLQDIDLNEIEGNVSIHQVKRCLAEFLKIKKLEKKGFTKNTTYRVIGFYG